jgi:hypothetical protein
MNMQLAMADQAPTVFASNAQNSLNAKAKGTLPISPSSSNTTVALFGVAQALESMLDDMLSGFSSAQLLLPAAPSSVNVSAAALVGAVKIGEAKYIYPLAALNFLIVLLLIEEAAVFRGWKGLHRFNVSWIFPTIACIASTDVVHPCLPMNHTIPLFRTRFNA